jgi:hypothetical protein
MTSEADLEVELAEAKEEYRGNLDSDDAKQRLDEAKRAIVEARRVRREEAGVSGVTVGGDAEPSDGTEG